VTTYTDVFGGTPISPSELSYSAVALSANLTLLWPQETSTGANYAARIMDVTASAGSLTITLPDATQVSNGETILFNNKGAFAFSVLNAAGVSVASVAPGVSWQVYLTVNLTSAGVWTALQYGAQASAENAAALAGTGLVAIGSALSPAVPVVTFNSNFSAGTSDRGIMYVWTGAGGTFTLPLPGTVGNNWFLMVRNAGSGSLVVDPTGSPLIDGSSTKTFAPLESAIIVTDGTNFYTIGYGKATSFGFDYTAIAVPGTGNYTLTGSELNRISYNFTGVLTGNRVIIVPATVQQYWVSNNTTGAFTLTVKTAAGSGSGVLAGSTSILYCNGANVVTASTSGVSLPVSVAQGGTGATSPGGALINLGGTSVGIGVFTAADANAAFAALNTSGTF
jgi:hypothetical protein